MQDESILLTTSEFDESGNPGAIMRALPGYGGMTVAFNEIPDSFFRCFLIITSNISTPNIE